ncbi:MAG: hydrogenase 4 subunit B [Pseudomonadales bacterium]|jgi:hydrogenase-4 component B|nr:hydrogenase 4 subunit B [Pseudomonadales bacterium]MCP5337746.1 hydrogenase 4 subunit B [Pseudomonadales bacterium]
MAEPVSVLGASLAVVVGWLVIGASGLLRPHDTALVARLLFPLGAAASLVLAVAGFAGLSAPASTTILPLGLPELPVHLRIDPLAAFFLFLLGSASTGISVFGAGYFRVSEGTPPGLLCLQYHVFLASMAMVLLADDAYTFMVSWESMALASYFLVTTQHRIATIRDAGFLYLLLAHVGAIAILLCFGVLQGGSWQFSFDAMRTADLAPSRATLAFALALIGFGAKAGLVPLHVWLPEAHPAAPSPVSALMSGVMLKTAVYGLLRVSFDLLPAPIWHWGAVLLALGLFSGLFGAVFAAVQTDMKRLLAYSSIENLGVVFTGCGLALLFQAEQMPTAAALALAATLYHCLNHAMFKSLLFLATGSVLHATGERNLGRLGGLIRRMPWVAWLALIGTLAIAGLPPLNGFVSEWLMLQALLLTPEVPRPFMNMLIPLGASVLALTAALAAYVMVKFYGVVFLGQMREPALARAHDCGRLERLGLLWLAAACILLGLLPALVIGVLDGISTALLGASLARPDSAGWWVLVPLSAERASYSPLVFLLGIALLLGIGVIVATRIYRRTERRAPAWDCGFARQDARMQDSAEGFGQPIRHIFGPFFRMRRELPSPLDASPVYRVRVEDRFWSLLYLPLARSVSYAGSLVGRLQQGRIAVYLLYSFLTLLVLLVIVL